MATIKSSLLAARAEAQVFHMGDWEWSLTVTPSTNGSAELVLTTRGRDPIYRHVREFGPQAVVAIVHDAVIYDNLAAFRADTDKVYDELNRQLFRAIDSYAVHHWAGQVFTSTCNLMGQLELIDEAGDLYTLNDLKDHTRDVSPTPALAELLWDLINRELEHFHPSLAARRAGR